METAHRTAHEPAPRAFSRIRRVLVTAVIGAALVAAGCGGSDSAGNEQTASPRPAADTAAHSNGSRPRHSRTLRAFARRYLTDHVCHDAPAAAKLARRIGSAVDARPGTTWTAAATGICNETRR
jgi:hypothetical protein